jgi:hypothetical protein
VACFISLAISSVVASTASLTIFEAQVTALSKPFSKVGCPITTKPTWPAVSSAADAFSDCVCVPAPLGGMTSVAQRLRRRSL